jgi:hypothetical protein
MLVIGQRTLLARTKGSTYADRVRLRTGSAVLVLVLAGATASQARSPGASPGAKVQPCGPSSARTLAGDRVARVYAVKGDVYGCSDRGARSWRLGRESICIGSPEVQAPAVAGRLAAYGLKTCGIDFGSAEVVVTRLTDGRVLRRAAAVTGPLGAESYQSVDAVVLDPAGAAGWIAEGQSIISHNGAIEVHSLDAGGARRLDSGRGIDPRSLRLAGTTLSWRHSGRRRSATI